MQMIFPRTSSECKNQVVQQKDQSDTRPHIISKNQHFPAPTQNHLTKLSSAAPKGRGSPNTVFAQLYYRRAHCVIRKHHSSSQAQNCHCLYPRAAREDGWSRGKVDWKGRNT